MYNKKNTISDQEPGCLGRKMGEWVGGEGTRHHNRRLSMSKAQGPVIF